MNPTQRFAPPSGVLGKDLIAILELLAKPEDVRAALLEMAKTEERLKSEALEMRKEQTALLEAERQYNERKGNLDIEWANLRQEQAAFEAQKDQVRSAFTTREQKLDEREAVLNGRADALAGGEADLRRRENELVDKLMATVRDDEAAKRALDARAAELDAREAAVAERENAANEVAALISKARGN